MENVKRVPYGVSDFVKVVERNQYYVDKTMYLPLLEEEADNLFFYSSSPFWQERIHQYAPCLLRPTNPR